MTSRQLGSRGPVVSRLGLGCMAMSGVYGSMDDPESISTIQMALEEGLNLLDTGDFYGMGHNEMLIGRALAGRRDKVVLSVKFGPMRAPSGEHISFDARPVAVKNFLSYSLRRLGTDYIDIYRCARLDPAVPIEETVGAMAEMQRAGYIRYVSLSEVSAKTVRRANAVCPITDVQLEYSAISRNLETKVLPTLRELGIGVTAYAVLSRGLLSGSKPQAKGDGRVAFPRFAESNFEQNQKVAGAFQQVARERGISPAQLAIAWVLAQGEDIVPVVGSRTRTQLRDTLGALNVRLTAEELRRIDAAASPAKIAGTRYNQQQMDLLDSERI